MEKLRRLKLSGFRSIQELDLELGDLTVLIGANGAGKSNLLGFLDMLSSIASGYLQIYVGRKGGGSSILHYGPKETPVLTSKLRFEDELGWTEYAFALGFASPDRLIFTHEDVAFEREGESRPFSRLLDAGHAESELRQWVDSGDSALQGNARELRSRFAEIHAYHFHDTSENASIRTLQDVDRNRHLLPDAGNLAAFLHMLQVAHRPYFEHILDTIRFVVPFVTELVLEPDHLNAHRILLRWRDRAGYSFGPHELSDGSLRAIALVTALLQPEELLPAVLVLDEPELGLHPAAVSLIAQLVKDVSSKRQVIVATQSPRLLTEFAPEDVVVVERMEDEYGRGRSVFHRLERKELGDWCEEYSLGTLYELNVTGGGPR